MALRKRKGPPAEGRGGFMKPRRSAGISSLLMFAIVIAAAIFVMSVFFRVSDVQVEGNVHYTDEEIIQAVDIEDGDNLFFFDRFGAISRAFAKLPYIEEVSVERKLPNKVVISIVESEALAYLELGDETWTLDHSCKVLGKAAEGETGRLIPIVGFDPGTLYIGERLTAADGDGSAVDHLAEILYQMEARGLNLQVTRIDFSDPASVRFSYGGRYTVILGGAEKTEYKFGMFVAVLDKLLEGDLGIIDVSDTSAAHFSPN